MKFTVEKLLEPTARMTMYGSLAVVKMILYNILEGPIRCSPDGWDKLLCMPAHGVQEILKDGLAVNLGDVENPFWYYRPLYDQIMKERDRFVKRSTVNRKNAQIRWSKTKRGAA